MELGCLPEVEATRERSDDAEEETELLMGFARCHCRVFRLGSEESTPMGVRCPDAA
jgi:hypothetical protein